MHCPGQAVAGYVGMGSDDLWPMNIQQLPALFGACVNKSLTACLHVATSSFFAKIFHSGVC